ncbi:ADP-ribosylglycohydrolase family protein [Kitasatospora sp. NPDC051914]|uniref:ADP-ribosylglycohydrolase family protein n=1 Tax=Kitasatospora sp. NPDC051914 TaxID=3154945 RepID=UPI00341CC84C
MTVDHGSAGRADRVRGALLGGSLGDALGWPVEFLRLDDIRARFGPGGLRSPAAGGRGGQVTDDTQMTLFTAEGLLRGGTREDVHRAYLRWLLTQRLSGPERSPDGWLLGHDFLYASRAPGSACMSGLTGYRYLPPAAYGVHGEVNTQSKGCGTVMRSAPFGLAGFGVRRAFELAADCAQLTHGHPTGYLAAGAFAALVERLVAGTELRRAVEETVEQTAEYPGSEETVTALRRAVRVAGLGPAGFERVEQVGLGWIAEECLAVAVYAALAGADAREAMVLAANHSGDSDSTAAVCGNLVGAMYGTAGLPAGWIAEVEGGDVVLQVADDLLAAFADGDRDRIADRYSLAPAGTEPAAPVAPAAPAAPAVWPAPGVPTAPSAWPVPPAWAGPAAPPVPPSPAAPPSPPAPPVQPAPPSGRSRFRTRD